jgi:hypothetical protein
MAFLERNANSGSVSTGYDIDNSLCMEDANDESLIRNYSGDGDRRTWTYSTWIKKLNFGSNYDYMYLFGAANSSILFLNDDRLRIELYNGSSTVYADTSMLFRDGSAWYHIVVQLDSTQGTASDRVKIYINGVRVTSFNNSTYANMSQNAEFNIGEASSNYQFGYWFAGGANNRGFSGYVAETHYANGTAYEADDFGEFDDNGVWVPKKFEGSHGTKGFYFKFDDASNLGKDSATSGIGDFSENNITAVDQATDTCTNNFCTLNPLIPYAVQSGAPVISNGATFHNGSGGWTGMKGTIGINKGKWYWELSMGGAGGGVSVIHGIQTVTSASGESTATSAHNLLETAAFYVNGGHWIKDETSGRDDIAAGSITHTPGNTVVYAVALNMDDGEITYYANGSVISGLNEVDLDGLAGETVAPFASVYNQQLAWNFGGYTSNSISSAASDANGYGTFEYAPPSGYYALCTKNLAEYG